MSTIIKLGIFVSCLSCVAALDAQPRRSNPIVSHMFTADPSAHVWEDGRLYVYPSTDVSPPTGYATMDGYHVFSTDDMITWKDHGEILHSRDVEWGREAGGFMWAPDCAYRDGTYYYYFPHPTGKRSKGTWKIGVATSQKPASDFEVQGYIEGLKPLIDPCVFIDDDGQAYLYQGMPDQVFGVKLKDNMVEIDGEMVPQVGLDGFREGPFVFKREGIYYMIYPDDFPKFNKMRYAMSDSPLGPWECKGVFLDSMDVITTHGSCVEYKGQWYLFYHNGSLSGGAATNRSICFDPIYFNEDGTIQMVKPSLGVELPTFHQDINFNRMFGSLDVGNYDQAALKKHGILNDAVSSLEVPAGYVVDCYAGDHFTGDSWRFEHNFLDLRQIDCDDQISSIQVSRRQGPRNLVKNGSFELGLEKTIPYWNSRRQWSQVRVLGGAADQYYALKYQGRGAARDLTQQIAVEPNTDYQLSASLKIDPATEGQVLFDLLEDLGDDCHFELSASQATGDWVQFSATFNSGKHKTLTLRCGTSRNFKGSCGWDDIAVYQQN